jgi:hypothetical protein
MGKLLQQLEEMHIRIAEMASHEENLLKALSEALTRLDEQLLADVQTIASEHEVRRTAILGELQGLASSIGMFQIPRAAVTARDGIEAEPAAYIPSAGDWREAASNIADEIDENGAAAAPRALFPHERRPQASVPFSLAERRRRAALG